MNITGKIDEATKSTADMLVLWYQENSAVLSLFPSVNKELNAFFKNSEKDFSLYIFHTHGVISATRVCVVGPSKKSIEMTDILAVGALLGKKVKEFHYHSIALSLPTISGFSPHEVAKGLVEGLVLGTYEFLRHKSKVYETPIEDITILSSKKDAPMVEKGIFDAEITTRATIVARDLVNEPSSVTTPTYLGEVAKNLSKNYPSITVDIYGKSEMKKFGMGGLLGVAKGSDEEPKFIRLSYKGKSKKTLVLVGKGLTFDSGGLSIKTGEGMETMKLDMAGAATILGIFSVLPLVAPDVSVVGLIAATENMPSGKAIKPGDIVTAMNGKTIEIVNTDAEGRVILADALSFAVKYEHPDVMIDLATLTGACMVALGEDMAGLFSTNEGLTKELKEAAKKTGELLWELPLVDSYKEMIEGHVADIKNSAGKKYGGAIIAALFLREFVSKTIPWAHIDIAGPAFCEKNTGYTPYGGTGYGVRMLLSYIH